MNTKLFVGNLAPGITKEAITGAFSPHGSVSAVDLAINRLTARFRGFAIVTMDTREGAQKAIQALHGSKSNGRLLSVCAADERYEAGGFLGSHTPRREVRKLY